MSSLFLFAVAAGRLAAVRAAPFVPATPAVVIEAPGELVLGDSLVVRVRGPAGRSTVHVALERDVLLDSARARGRPAGRWRLRFDTTVVLDARGVRQVYLPLWAVTPTARVSGGDTIARSAVRVTAQVALSGAAQATAREVRLRGRAEGVQLRHLREDGLDGALALPAGAGPHPLVIALHGSEGGDSLAAARLAVRFASRGFATLALNYVVYAYGRPPLPGVPSAFLNVPVELVDAARARVAREPGVDTARTALWGVSKGAEFALVIAATRRWPSAVVACVPSDVVWSGFGAPLTPGIRFSSWSTDGAGLPYIPYDRYEDVFTGTATARAVHDRSRARFADSATVARIQVEQIAAPTLLIGATRDEVWDSAAMAATVATTMRQAGRTPVELLTIGEAGHGICGDGTTPSLFTEAGPLPTRTPPDAQATARGNAESWARTIGFLRRALGVPRDR